MLLCVINMNRKVMMSDSSMIHSESEHFNESLDPVHKSCLNDLFTNQTLKFYPMTL